MMDWLAASAGYVDGFVPECCRQGEVRLLAGLCSQQERGKSGGAANELLAKITSDLRKPDGLTLGLERGKVPFLRPLPVRALHGVGKVTEATLLQLGLRPVGDLRDYPGDLLPAGRGPQGAGWLSRIRPMASKNSRVGGFEKKAMAPEANAFVLAVFGSAAERTTTGTGRSCRWRR